jgi:hypothetical protein
MKMGATSFFYKFVNTYDSASLHIPEDSDRSVTGVGAARNVALVWM